MKNIRYLFCLVWAFTSTTILVGQDANAPILEVQGEVLTPLSLTLKDLKSMPISTIEATDNDNIKHTFKGVVLDKVLEKAGVTLDKQLRGENLLKYILATAADNYQVLFSLAEIDPLFSKQGVLLAFEMDGKPLDSGYGPLRLVVPEDQRHARWIRELRKIQVVFAK